MNEFIKGCPYLFFLLCIIAMIIIGIVFYKLGSEIIEKNRFETIVIEKDGEKSKTTFNFKK